MMAFLAKLLLGLPGLANGLLAYLNKRSDNTVLVNQANVAGDVSVGQAQLAAYVEERKIIAQERAEQHLSPWTAWMIPTAFGLCMLHFGAIVLDSTFLFNWRVAKLPPPYDEMERYIVLSVIGVAGVAGTVRKVFSK
ncbi:hypothetical protein [Methylobacterium sp.]|uniref:hypothetical protein n=1 Tax=Methylobacterium sp. TaxID=409 RepID=UPI0025F138BC|nr:hypothetical protein [Methylobacterium sp.]